MAVAPPIAVAPSAAGPAPIPGPTPAPSTAPARERWLRTVGAGRYPSVLAERWTVQGMAKVTGDADATALEAQGSVSVGGVLRAGNVSIEGSLEVSGTAHIEGRAEIQGPARFDRSVDAGDLEVAGTLQVQGPVVVRGLARWAGETVLHADARCGRLVVEGAIESPGALDAESVAIHFDRDSRIETLRAPTITVTRPAGLPFKLPLIGKDPPTLTVLRMEGSHVELQGTDVEFLRADQIVLGPGCHVARVIGDVVKVDPTSHVGPESRSPPPYGIRR